MERFGFQSLAALLKSKTLDPNFRIPRVSAAGRAVALRRHLDTEEDTGSVLSTEIERHIFVLQSRRQLALVCNFYHLPILQNGVQVYLKHHATSGRLSSVLVISLQNLLQLLERAASQSAERGLSFYAPGKVDAVGRRLTYDGLLDSAKKNAQAVRQLKGIAPGSVVLLHFNNHFDNVEWLWSVIAAGYLPAISTPMANDAEARKRHLNHLQQVLGHPVVRTSDSLRPEFAAVDSLNIQTIEEVRSLSEEYSSASSENEESKSASSDAESRYSFTKSAATSSQYGFSKQKDDVAILMLTSGSSGNAKAVCLRHGQILQAIDGKNKFHGTASEDTFLNFIGLDHVANLAEVHLHAMGLAAEQVHVQVADLLSNPATFFDLVHKHRAAYSFVPNFFLASLKRTLGQLESPVSKSWDLSCLRALISGDEADLFP